MLMNLPSTLNRIQEINFSRHDTIAIISMSGKDNKFEQISHDKIIDQKEMQMFEGKTFLSFKSWNVYAEISNLLATTIMGATRIVTRDRFNCKIVSEISDEYKVNVLQLTAYQVQQMRPASVTGNYFESLELILCTGPKITESLLKFSALCFPNSTLYPHLTNFSPPATPGVAAGQLIFQNGQFIADEQKAEKKGFLRTLFKKARKQKAAGV